ncbi:slit homolog 3 protein-like isoform X2 [Mytilus californianus]|uniref:slit homolog 3 protein-like isoform X2 n=1 Tax=Mytilus californianus TaxID=6549 RepID=UPI0022469556|nr:slit homolog 3 protein-like isoform X2 [Mytilus californianus]
MSKTLYVTIISYIITSYHGINACPTASCGCVGTKYFCSNRQLTSVPDGIEANVTLLHLEKNRLIAIDDSVFSGFTELQKLHLNDNEIISITANAFQDLTSLERIYLQDNQITSLPSGLFSANINLVNVYVQENNLTMVSAAVFGAITSITTIQITDNPLVCCTMTDLLIWKNNQSSLTDGSFTATCYDFNTETNINSFDSSNCSIVAGQWSMWTDSSCSVTCGDGIITRSRNCDNPAPKDSGPDCIGSSNETIQCNLDPCPEFGTLVISLVLGICGATGVICLIILILLKKRSRKKVKHKTTKDRTSMEKHHEAWT